MNNSSQPTLGPAGPIKPIKQVSLIGPRKRILFVGESVSLAHVGRPALLARWAREAGHDVHFACGPAFAAIAQNEGHKPSALKTISSALFYQRLNKGQFFYTRSELDAYVQAERELIQRLKPDLVVGDFRLSLHVSANLERTPMLALNNAHWSPGYAGHLPPPNIGAFKLLPPGPRAALFRWVRPLVYRLFAKPIDDLRQKHGLSRLNDLRKCYTAGDACAYLDVPELFPLSKMPKDHFYLGPVSWQPSVPPSLNLNALPVDAPLAYVSMGSTGNELVLPGILKALDQAGFCAVVSGVEPARVAGWLEAMPSMRGRLYAGRCIDPGAILDRATLTICHGGSGTVYQSLSRGVPLLCVPNNPDQVLISNAVVNRGAGCLVKASRNSNRELLAILVSDFREDNSLQRNASQMAGVLNAWDTRARWLHWLVASENRVQSEYNGSERNPWQSGHVQGAMHA